MAGLGAKRVLILGCGYVGLALGRRLLRAGHTVFGLRRTSDGSRGASDADAGLQWLTGDITRPETLAVLPRPFDWVVHCVSSSRGGPETYRTVYLDGMHHVLDWLGTHPPEAFAYTSSTSVYGQTSGEWVDETSPVSPGTETGEVLVATERLVLEAAKTGRVSGRILRVAGIYGPGRGHLFQQFLTGEARLQGDGSRWINMIHREDVASALEAVLARGIGGEVYNAVDDEPVSQRDFLAWLAARMGRPLPPVASEEALARRKRGLTHKRVRNRKLRDATGWAPGYPTYREGYAEAVAAALESGPRPAMS